MPRKKAKDQNHILSRPIVIRVTEATFKRLDGIRKQSRQPTIGEVARKILSSKQLKLFYFDITMNPIMEELALIRKELKAIGININEITRTFNQEGEKANWIAAIKNDGLSWPQVSDLKYWNGDVVKLYGVRAVPQNFLIDPEGKIIVVNLRGEELNKKLETLLGK